MFYGLADSNNFDLYMETVSIRDFLDINERELL